MRRIFLLIGLSACGPGAPGEHDVPPARASDPHAAHRAPVIPAGGGAQPVLTVDVPDRAREALGIRTEPARAGAGTEERRHPATVRWDPLAVVRISAQPGGQVREISLPREGETVRAGAVVARLYAPEVRGAYEELFAARSLGEPWSTAARQRLVALGVHASEVDAALANGRVPETYGVRAPRGGVVVERPARLGVWLAPGAVLASTADPAALVAEATVAGPVPAAGTAVLLRDPATQAAWSARVSSALPTADAAGVQVRLVPDAIVPVGRPLIAEWIEESGAGVWVPRSAVIDTGERRVVFVAVEPGRYAPREVVLGGSAGGEIQLLLGVEEGEHVVVSGAFLLDSETQIGAMGHAGHGG